MLKSPKRNSQNPSQKQNLPVTMEVLDTPCVQNNEFIKNPMHDDVLSSLKNIRVKNIGRVIIGNLNVNSLYRKVDALNLFIPGNIDILVITETKLDPANCISMVLKNLIKTL